MQQVFLISILITFLFCLFKFLEMKYLENELKPLKFFVRDALIVFSSSLVVTYGCFHLDGSITDFFNVMTKNKSLNIGSTEIFTDAPGF
jgi:hypothetical protein